MRLWVILLAAVLPGCSSGFVPSRPSEEIIDRLEQRLVEHPCIGSLDRWERHYTYASEPFLDGLFGWRNRWYHYGRIDVDLRQAGFEEFRGGRHVHARSPEHQGSIDDRRYNVAVGQYDVSADRLSLTACGSNI